MPASATATDLSELVPVPPPVPGRLAEQTGFLLRVARVHAGHWLEAMVDAAVPPRTHEVLQALADLGPRSQSELAEALYINSTLMVKVIDGLEQAGLLTRERNPADRRSYALTPTSAGRHALAGLNTALDRADSGLTRRLSPAETRELDELLATVAVALGGRPALPAGLRTRTAYLLEAAHVAVRDRGNQRLREFGISTTQYGPLALLAATGPTSQRAIAGQLGFSAAAIQQTVDRLEHDGLVERRRSPTDRRAYALELTAAGHTLVRQAGEAIAEINRGQLDELLGGPDRNHQLRQLLLKLLDGPPS